MNYPRQPAKELSLPTRLPLVSPLAQRAQAIGDSARDSRLVNGYVEIGEDQEPHVVKRPGFVLQRTVTGASQFLGAIFESGSYYEIWAIGGQAKLYLNGSEIGVLALDFQSGSYLPYTFTTVTHRGGSTLRIQSRLRAYWLDGVTVKEIPNRGQSLGTFTCTLTAGSTLVTMADTSALSKYGLVSGTGILPDTLVQSIVSPTQITLTNAATVGGAQTLSILTGGPFPFSNTTGQCAYLDRSTYLIDRFTGEIVGTDPDDITAFDPLNSIYAMTTSDQAVYLGEQSSRIVVFKEKSIEFFRSSGAAAGSTLAPERGLRIDVGCSNPESVQLIDGVYFWQSASSTSQDSVWMMENLRAKEISTPAVRRFVSSYYKTRGIGFSVSGNTFYAICPLFVSGHAMVYHLQSGMWYVWTAFGTENFPFAASVRNTVLETSTLFFQVGGKSYEINGAALLDENTEIVLDIYPPEFDGGLRKAKFLSKMRLVADQEDASRLFLRVSDDNQRSWTNWREFDLSHENPTLDNCGTFIKRTFHFRHTDPTRCRVRWVELELYPGVA